MSCKFLQEVYYGPECCERWFNQTLYTFLGRCFSTHGTRLVSKMEGLHLRIVIKTTVAGKLITPDFMLRKLFFFCFTNLE